MKISKENLTEWAVNYIKSRDIIARAITGIEMGKEGWDIVVHAKDGDRFYAVVPEISSFDEIAQKAGDRAVCIVTYNTRHNLDRLVDGWSRLSALPKLSLIFANPKSSLDQKWLIVPYTHEFVTEKASLKRGLKAMFDMVEEWRG